MCFEKATPFTTAQDVRDYLARYGVVTQEVKYTTTDGLTVMDFIEGPDEGESEEDVNVLHTIVPFNADGTINEDKMAIWEDDEYARYKLAKLGVVIPQEATLPVQTGEQASPVSL